jgi:hypothetical protein
MFEALLFLKVNREIWDLTMVTIAMKNKEPREMNRDMDIYWIASPIFFTFKVTLVYGRLSEV